MAFSGKENHIQYIVLIVKLRIKYKFLQSDSELHVCTYELRVDGYVTDLLNCLKMVPVVSTFISTVLFM